MDRTLVICKPDAVERGLVGEIVSRLESRGFRPVAAELRTIDKETLGLHYEEHAGEPYFPDLVAYLTRGPSLLLVMEGPEDTHSMVRTMMGATDPRKAVPGSIRGDLATSTPENLIHGSDSPESAEREIALFFPGLVTAALGA